MDNSPKARVNLFGRIPGQELGARLKQPADVDETDLRSRNYRRLVVAAPEPEPRLSRGRVEDEFKPWLIIAWKSPQRTLIGAHVSKRFGDEGATGNTVG